MVLVQFEYLRSDAECKLLIGQFYLSQVKQVEFESPDMFKNCPRLPTGRGGIFICSKLGQNLSEMEVRTFVRIQRAIWDHLLASRLKLSRAKLYLSFRAEQLAKNNNKNNYELVLIVQSALFFLSFSFLACRCHFFAKIAQGKFGKGVPIQGLVFR